MSNAPAPTKITIIGLGLMGGSMAAALRRTGNWSITGYDANPASRKFAEEHKLIDRFALSLRERC